MPKDEFDFNDPLELNGHAFVTEEDTTAAMSECFVHEFMRMGYTPARILALFRNPQYLGMHMVLQKRGEPFVRDCIQETFARWGRTFSWHEVACAGATQKNLSPTLSCARQEQVPGTSPLES